jgi:hypothetical protein
MILDLDAFTRNELASMVYARWSSAFENLKKTKSLTWESTGKFCPRAEWPSYHETMLAGAQKELEYASRLKETVCKYSPLICGE